MGTTRYLTGGADACDYNVANNAYLMADPPNYIGPVIYSDDCSEANLWATTKCSAANDTVYTEYGGASVKITCAPTVDWDDTYLTKTISSTNLSGCHFAVRAYIHEGNAGEANSYTGLYGIELELLDGTKVNTYRLWYYGGTSDATRVGFNGWYWFSGDVNETLITASDFDINTVTKIRLNLITFDEANKPEVSLDKIVFYEPANETGLVVFELDGGYTRQKTACEYLATKGMKGAVFANSILTGANGYLTLSNLQELYGEGHTIGIYAHDGNMWGTMNYAEKEALFVREQAWLTGNSMPDGIRIAAESGTVSVTDEDINSLLPKYIDSFYGGSCPSGQYTNNALYDLQVPRISFMGDSAADSNFAERLINAINDKTLMVYTAHVSNDANLEQFKIDVNTIAAEVALGNIAVVTPLQLVSGTTAQHSVAGKVGDALSFDGTSYVDTNQTFESTFQDSFTVNMWANPTTNAGGLWGTVVVDANFENIVLMAVEKVGTMVSVDILQNQYFQSLSGGINDVFQTDIWQMITVVVQKVSDTKANAYFYYNGELGGSSIGNDFTMSTFTFTNPLRIGSWGGGTDFFTGSLDDFRIYNKALSADEVKALYEKLCPKPAGDLNGDCQVDFFDFAVLADSYVGSTENWLKLKDIADTWLACGLINQDNCWQ